jgi:hypothetical protein
MIVEIGIPSVPLVFPITVILITLLLKRNAILRNGFDEELPNLFLLHFILFKNGEPMKVPRLTAALVTHPTFHSHEIVVGVGQSHATEDVIGQPSDDIVTIPFDGIGMLVVRESLLNVVGWIMSMSQTKVGFIAEGVRRRTPRELTMLQLDKHGISPALWAVWHIIASL